MTEPRQALDEQATLPPETPQGTLKLTPDQVAEAARRSEPSLPRVPGYEILGELGRGGMGVVYKARQHGLNRIVALKMILGGSHAGEAELSRFRIEAEAIARLQHPNIVQIHEVGDHEGLPYFSLEFCDGGGLDRKLAGVPLPPREAAALVETLARAMNAAHQQGIVHRDLKPANVLLAAFGLAGEIAKPQAALVPKITDFGLAKKLDEQGQTATGSIMGTPSYMAPEQAGGLAGVIGPTTDVYALGAILYECLTGRPPFRAASPLDTIMQVVSAEPVPPRQLQPGTPADLETICLKCLRKEPSRRYGNAGELADDLRHFLNDEPIRARPVGKIEQAAKWARRHPAAAGLIGVSVLAIVLLLALGTIFTDQLRRERDHAREQQQIAESERQRAEANELEAQRQLDQARRALLATDLRVVAIWERDPARGLALLDDPVACPPAYRDFAWGFFYRLCKHALAASQQPRSFVFSTALSSDGTVLVAGGAELTRGKLRGVIRIWDVATKVERPPLEGHTHFVASVAISPDGRRLASASADGTVKLWDLATGQEQATLARQVPWVTCVKFLPDSRSLVSAVGTSVKVWDAVTGQEQRTLTGHTGYVTALAVTSDGKTLASASYDGLVKVWNLATGQEQATLRGHQSYVSSVTFTADNQTLFSASYDRTIRVWDMATNRERAVWRGFTQPITAIAVSTDQKTLVSVGGDPGGVGVPGETKLWDWEAGKERVPLTGAEDFLTSVAFSSNSQRLAVGGWDGRVRV